MTLRTRWTALALLVLVSTFLLRAEEAPVPAARAAFLKMIDRPRVDPAVDLKEAEDIGDDLKSAKFSYLSEADERVSGLCVFPPNTGNKLPCVILLHGTGSKKESNLGMMKKLAKRGCAAIAIDGRFHGERVKEGTTQKDAYNGAILKRFKGETKSYPLYWDTVWDVMRLIDVIKARDDIDGDRIGVIGFSKGGIETYFLAAMDPRVDVAIPCIGVQSFKWGLENNAWQGRTGTVDQAFKAAAKEAGVEKPDAEFAKKFFDKVLPGVYGELDGPEVVPLIAPRALLMINGDTDEHTPLPGVMLCAEKTKAAYEKAKAADHFKQIVEPKTGHSVNAEATQEAIDFFAKWLNF